MAVLFEVTKVSFMLSISSVLFFNLKPFLLSAVAMSDPHQNQSQPTLSTDNYPVPLSPPLPSISKQIELNRAMTASSRSTLFSLSTNHILYEDEWIIAVNKPQGIYCENVLSSVPTLLNSGSEVELHLANRLDRDTSGVMVITKSHKVAAKFVKAFTEHKVKKTYIALCIGVPPKWKRVTVRSGHGRSRFGMWRVYAASDVGRSLPGGSVVRDMETAFEVVAINGKGILEDEGSSSNSSSVVVVEEKSVKEDGDVDGDESEIVVRAYPKSGRTHQIRLHCQYLGISIKGDVKYEGACEWKGATFDAHHLHAEMLSFQHPVTGACVMLRAPLPPWCTVS
ncbi:PREDICTED: RNA pseudouridine synthase 1 isoform X2 [Lupinus angustifolius]|uniref:RNA pseudouridine synthase 1 isoform X2 n=1 Tax=Lupinus angustifolius TaxID=3871 RepID=UPI00092F58D6|nr:PREDICTED: RNA pseudouridine synthase 1 isoform X2 [Lupinus angustifolius]